MKYLCLAYYDEKKFEALAPEEVAALVRDCKVHDTALRESGRLHMLASLSPPRAGASIRPNGGRPTFTDGPYTETKEQVGAFFIIDADTREDALAIAALHPAARLGEAVGWGVELRPIETLHQI